jgi:hypothetical protein
VGTVKSTTSRALERLRSVVGRPGVDETDEGVGGTNGTQSTHDANRNSATTTHGVHTNEGSVTR